ncbi:PadR family transcriptional regulator [Streptomyces sp. NPDC047081]|uniref:PadR family transcriptional regulator n=1 Tax=Streptomyces sp. NPDC047081 TaxID=3154706 RepID=UPI003401626B
MYSDYFPMPYEAFRGGYGGGGRRGRRGGRFPYGRYGPAGGGWPGPGRRYGGGRRALLTLLKTEGPRNAAQLLQALESRGYGPRFPGPAFVGGMLRQFEDEGLVRGTDGDGESGRTYELTEAGTAYVNRVNDPAGLWGLPTEAGLALHRAIHATTAAARQVALDGDAEAPAEAVRLLDETRRKLYRLLADRTG